MNTKMLSLYVNDLKELVKDAEYGDWVDIASSSALIERIEPAHEILEKTKDLLDENLQAAVTEFKEIDFEEMTTHLIETPEIGIDERFVVFKFDKYCGAANRLDCVPLIDDAVDVILSNIILEPTKWQTLLPLASNILENAMPNMGDPARAIWFSIQASSIPIEVEEEEDPIAGLPLWLQQKLGRSIVVPIEMKAAAGSEEKYQREILFKEEQYVIQLERVNNDMTIYIQSFTDEHGQPEPKAVWNGEKIVLEPYGDRGGFRTKGMIGDWKITLGPHTCLFTIQRK